MIVSPTQSAAIAREWRLLTRRAMVLSPALAFGAARAATSAIPRGVPPGRRLMFDVLRNGESIGKHSLMFAIDGDTLTIAIDIKIAVGLGGIKLFRYEMEGSEVWQDGRFAALSTTSNDDGSHHTATVQRTADGLAVKSAGLRDYTAPANAAPLTHWSRAALSGPLLSPQDGQIMQAPVVPAGKMDVPVDGRTVSATGYDIHTHHPVQDWYDAEQIWVSTRASASGDVEYRRTA